jgi:hypothetical protein
MPPLDIYHVEGVTGAVATFERGRKGRLGDDDGTYSPAAEPKIELELVYR